MLASFKFRAFALNLKRCVLIVLKNFQTLYFDLKKTLLSLSNFYFDLKNLLS